MKRSNATKERSAQHLRRKTLGRDYNGPESELMNQLSKHLGQHIPLDLIPDWPTVSVYIARACVTLEKDGWNRIPKSCHDVDEFYKE